MSRQNPYPYSDGLVILPANHMFNRSGIKMCVAFDLFQDDGEWYVTLSRVRPSFFILCGRSSELTYYVPDCTELYLASIGCP